MGSGSPVAKDEFADWLWRYRHPDFPVLYAFFVMETRRISGLDITLERFADAAFVQLGVEELRTTILSKVPPHL